jgi:hypothetical protein
LEEVLARASDDLDLMPALQKHHDAVDASGRNVRIKATMQHAPRSRETTCRTAT